MKTEQQTPALMGEDDGMQQQEFISQLTAEAVEYLHGRARKDVVRKLTQSTNTPETMGAITYKLARGLLEKHKKAGMSMELDMGVAMGVATEIIDMQVEMLERVAPDKLGDPQKTREDALLRTMLLHAEQLGDDPAAKEEAQQMLRGFMQDGTVDQAFGYVNQRAAQEGVSVDDMMLAGNKLAAQAVGGGQKPLAQGVQQGLMNQPPPQ